MGDSFARSASCSQQYPQQYPQQPPPRAPEPPEPDVPTHAPKFALYVGGRINFVGFGGAFLNDRDTGESATTGRIAKNGASFQLDVGARLAKSWIPYAFLEHGLLGRGGYFEADPNAHSSTTFYGGGLRHVSGDPDSVSFLQDLSVGVRSIRVSSGTESFTLSTFEWVRLGLGAEIRLHTRFVLSPLASISAGGMNDVSGTISGRPGGVPGIAPDRSAVLPYRIQSGTETALGSGSTPFSGRPYVALSIGMGFHFDLLGD